MRKLYLLFLLSLATIVMAGPVDVTTARRHVADFLAKQTKKGMRKAPPKGKTWQTTVKEARKAKQYYVFNVGSDNGFVVAAADDAVQPILGYTTSGTFSNDNIPEAMQGWLTTISAEVDYMTAQANAAPVPLSSHPAIAPLLTTTWNQDSPYNDQCPKLPDGGTCVTGCIATALAQVLNYHKWPEHVEGLSAYTTKTRSINVTELPATTFAWNKMLDSYSASSPQDTKTEVAKLLRYCGQASHMDYGPSSGSYYQVDMFKNYLQYDDATRSVSRKDYTATAWDNLIYAELQARRPVLYAGSNNGGGHAWVVDGYDGNGLFHVNWGWGGYCNGYFLLSVLNPDGSQAVAGATLGGDGFSLYNEAIIGMQKDDDVKYTPDITYSPFSTTLVEITNEPTGKKVIQRTSHGTFPLPPTKFSYANLTPSEQKLYKAGAGIYNVSGERIAKWHDFDLYDENYGNWAKLPPQQADGRYSLWNWDFPEYEWTPPGDGVYYMKPFANAKDNSWDFVYPLSGTDKYYIKLEVNGDVLTMTASTAGRLIVNRHSVTGTKEKGDPIAVTLNVTNNYVTDNAPNLYLFVNDQRQTAVGVHLDAGTTGNVDMHFTPQTTGTITVKISPTDKMADAIYSFTLDITEPKAYNLTGKVQHLDRFMYNNERVVSTTTPRVRLVLTNDKPYAYQKVIDVYAARKVDDNGNFRFSGPSAKIQANIPAKGSQTIDVTLSSIENNAEYIVFWKYNNAGSMVDGGGGFSGNNYFKVIANPFLSNGVLYNKTSGNTAEVINYKAVLEGYTQTNGYAGTLNIAPTAVDGAGNRYRVTNVATNAVTGTNGLKVILPNSLDSFAAGAFTSNTNLNVYALRLVCPYTQDAFRTNSNTTFHYPANGTGYTIGTVKKDIAKHTFTDAQTASIPNGDVYEMNFTRKLQNNKWNSLTLPFDMYADVLKLYFGNSVQVAVFDPASTNSGVNFKTVSTDLIPAGTPFLVKPAASSGTEINGFTVASFMSGTPVAQTVTSADGNWNFVGTFNPTVLDAGKDYFFGADSKYYLTAPGSDAERTIYGFRAYLRPGEGAVLSKGGSIFVDGNDVTTSVATVELPVRNVDAVYNLQGQRLQVPFDRLPAGVYIVGGKKVLKK